VGWKRIAPKKPHVSHRGPGQDTRSTLVGVSRQAGQAGVGPRQYVPPEELRAEVPSRGSCQCNAGRTTRHAAVCVAGAPRLMSGKAEQRLEKTGRAIRRSQGTRSLCGLRSSSLLHKNLTPRVLWPVSQCHDGEYDFWGCKPKAIGQEKHRRAALQICHEKQSVHHSGSVQ